jgi:WD40 repeat protein
MHKQILFFSFAILHCANTVSMEHAHTTIPCNITYLRDKGFKRIPYGIECNEIEKIKNNISSDHICLKPQANRIYKNIATPFLVKNDNDTFFIQDNVTGIAELNIQSGKKKTGLQYASFIRSCIKRKKDNLLISGTNDGRINIWSIDSPRHGGKNIYPGAIVCLAEENNLLCLASLNGTISILHLLDDMPAYKIIYTHKLFNKANRLFYSESDVSCAHSVMLRDKLLYAGSSHGHINVHDIRTEDTSNTFKAHKDRVSCLIACKHNDQLFYSGSFDGSIKKWDIRNLKECLQSFEHQKYGIGCMYQTNDGKKIYSGGADGIRIWDVSNEQPPLKPWEIHAAYTLIDNEIKQETNLHYVDCIAANDDESELYIANIPSGVTILRPLHMYTLEEFIDIAQ